MDISNVKKYRIISRYSYGRAFDWTLHYSTWYSTWRDGAASVSASLPPVLTPSVSITQGRSLDLFGYVLGQSKSSEKRWRLGSIAVYEKEPYDTRGPITHRLRVVDQRTGQVLVEQGITLTPWAHTDYASWDAMIPLVIGEHLEVQVYDLDGELVFETSLNTLKFGE